MSKGGPKTVSSLTKGQQGVANLVAEFLAPGVLGEKYSPQAQDLLKGSKIGQGATPYSGTLVSPLLPEYNQVKNLAFQSSPNKLDNASQSAVLNLLGGGGAQELSPSATTKYFQENVSKPMFREFDRSVAPRIKEAFAVGGGTFNSRRGIELSNAVGDIQQTVAQQLGAAQLQNQQFGAQLGQQARVQGLAAAPGLRNQNITQAALLEGVLSPFQERKDLQTNAQYQEFLRTAPEANPYLNLAMGFVNSPQLGVYNKPNTVAPIAGALGGALLGPLLGGLGGGLAGAFGFGAGSQFGR
jgi:hypothetical protein